MPLKKLKRVFFAALLLFTLNLSAQNPYIQHYTTYDGMPSNTVYYIYQDSKKFIWFATDAGVVRYDGTTFTNFRKNDGLNSNEIIRIKEDSIGRIWFFNLNGRFNFFYQNKIFNETNAPFLDSFKNKFFFIDFYNDKDQEIYFYNTWLEIFCLNTQNQVKKYGLDEKIIRDKTNGKNNGELLLRYLCKNSKDEFILWIGGEIFKLNTSFKNPIKISDLVNIWQVYPGRNNSFYISAYNKGVIKVNEQFKIEDVLMPFKMPDQYTGIRSILEDTGGFLWIVTFDKGVFCLWNNKIVRHFDIKEGQAIIQDNEKNIWISSMNDGVYKISPYLNAHRHYENSLFQNRGITALDTKHGMGLWFTNGKSVYLLKNNDFYTLKYQIEDFPSTQVFQLKNNTLIIGAKSSFSYAFKGIAIDYITKQITYKSLTKALYKGKEMVINKREDKLNSFSGGSVYIYNIYKYFQRFKAINIGEHINNTFYNLNDDLIINAKKNYLLHNDSITPYPALSGFDNKIITDHLILNDSTELFNIDGDSIYIYSRHNFINLTAAFNSPIDLQVRKAVYKKPTLYLSTFRNIYKCDNPLNIHGKEPVKLQLIDINFRNIHDILVYKDSLYVASDDGLTIIPEKTLSKIRSHTPIPYFQYIIVNDTGVDLTKQKITLTGNTRIKIGFGSIQYSGSPALFSYKLEGFDHEWTTGRGINVVYQNVPRGNYTFKLKVCKETSEWSNPIEFKITIKAHFWQHPLFFVFLSLLFTGLIALIIIRRKNIQIKRRELDNQLITLEQKALQSMMNPHFIFNSLGSIQTYLLEKKSGEAGLYLSQFARLIRQNLNAINAASIDLEEEIDRLKNYLDLERLRMENKFDYNIEIDENLEEAEVQIPSMIIQPFVENAIWHGIAAMEDKGQINIKFHRHDEKSVKVIIEDNGIGIKRSEAYSTKQEKHLHLGMEMTRKRLELLGKKFSIKTAIEFFETFPGAENPGTRVVLVVPIGL
ncbi:MAG: histidine kinase [Bacteroidales bacterium]